MVCFWLLLVRGRRDAATINVFQKVPVCTRQGRGQEWGALLGVGGAGPGQVGPPPSWARHLGPFLPTESPQHPGCYRNNSTNVGDQKGSPVSLPPVQLPPGRDFAQCPFLARLLMLLDEDAEARALGLLRPAGPCHPEGGRDNPAGTLTPATGDSEQIPDRSGIMPSGGDTLGVVAEETSSSAPPTPAPPAPVPLRPATRSGHQLPRLRSSSAGRAQAPGHQVALLPREPLPGLPPLAQPSLRPQTPDPPPDGGALGRLKELRPRSRRVDAVRGPDRAPAGRECTSRLRRPSRPQEDFRETARDVPVEQRGGRRAGPARGHPGPPRTGPTQPCRSPMPPAPRGPRVAPGQQARCAY